MGQIACVFFFAIPGLDVASSPHRRKNLAATLDCRAPSWDMATGASPSAVCAIARMRLAYLPATLVTKVENLGGCSATASATLPPVSALAGPWL